MPPTKKTKRKEDTTNRAARENNDMRIIFVASEGMVSNREIERCRRHEEKEQHQ